jgi:xylulokinase
MAAEIFLRRPSVDAVLGVDVGTSSLKAGLFALDGTLLGLSQAAYPVSSPEPDAREQDPRDWWAALVRTCRELLGADHPQAPRVRAVAFGGQAPTLAPADANFQPTHPAITWLDPRPSAEAERIYARLDQPVPVWGSWASQIAWFARHRSQAMRQTRWLLGCPDYLVSRLIGAPAALLSLTPAELELTGVNPGRIPPAWELGAVVGQVCPSAAEQTELPAGTPVVGGQVDGLLGVLGSGVGVPGDGCVNCGTSGTFSVVCEPPLGFAIFGLQVAGAATNTSGSALDWFATSVMDMRCAYTDLLATAASVPAGADGLLFLPHLSGDRGVAHDAYARGAWVGLTLAHDRRHLLRALLEGVALSFRSMQDWLEQTGAPVREVRCVGGQARSDVWNQIKADALNRRVLVPRVVEAATVGAAVVAGLGIGAYASRAAAMAAMVRIDRVFEPDPSRSAVYARLLETYQLAYPALRESNWRLHDLAAGAAQSPSGKSNGYGGTSPPTSS